MSEVQRLIAVMRYERAHGIGGGTYKWCQCSFAYNSNHMEGCSLSEDQTVQIFERGSFTGSAPVDDIVETANHFDAFDYLLDSYQEPLSEEYLKRLHSLLFKGTRKASMDSFEVGEYKRMDNIIVAGVTPVRTTSAADVPAQISLLLASYDAPQTLEDICDFHVRFERIHPFSDGNGRVGRLIMFKESLRAGIMPFIITDDMRPFYIQGIREYGRLKTRLLETCGLGQDNFECGVLPVAESAFEVMRDEPDFHLEPSDHDVFQG